MQQKGDFYRDGLWEFNEDTKEKYNKSLGRFRAYQKAVEEGRDKWRVYLIFQKEGNRVKRVN